MRCQLCHLTQTDLPPAGEEELAQALSMVRMHKAGGMSDILPQLILCGEAELWDGLLRLME